MLKKKISKIIKVGKKPRHNCLECTNIAIMAAATNDVSVRRAMLLEIREYSSRSIKGDGDITYLDYQSNIYLLIIKGQ